MHGCGQGRQAPGIGLEQQLHLLALLQPTLPDIQRSNGLQADAGHHTQREQLSGKSLGLIAAGLGGEGQNHLWVDPCSHSTLREHGVQPGEQGCL